MRNVLLNTLVAATSILLTYLAAEAAFCLVGVCYVPLRLQVDLPEDIRVFAQSTKAGVVPRAPIVLLGDSYAQGYGDWLLEVDPNRNGRFHSGHIIHDLTGRDVINFGQSGAGSAEGIAALPAVAFARAASAWYLRLPPPRVAVIYFYEGNDLNNNLGFLKTRVTPEAGAAVARIDAAIASYPAVLGGHAGAAFDFPLLRFLSRLVLRLFAEMKGAPPAEAPDQTPPAGSGQPNLVKVAGKPVVLPANLQSPALELSGSEREEAALVFVRSLAFLRRLFPDSPVLVVYVPSPLSSYELIGPDVSVQTYMVDRPFNYPRERVMSSSDAICDMIRAGSIGQGAGFLDARVAVRSISSKELVHGPRDFKHFNRAGMSALGRAVAEQVDQPLTQGACSRSGR